MHASEIHQAAVPHHCGVMCGSSMEVRWTAMMHLGGKKPHREEKVNRCVFFAHGGGPHHDALGYSKRAVLNLLFCLKKNESCCG